MTIKDDRKILETLIDNTKSTIGDPNSSPIDNSTFSQGPIFTMDFLAIKKKCDKKARKMIHNATGLMLTGNMVNDNPYLRNKMGMDIISLSGIIYQLEINEEMQKVLMEEVRLGAANARMFEVFGNLSKIIGELNKQLLQTVEAIKLTYKDIKVDIEDKDQELKAIGPGESGISRNKDGIIAMGTKELINETKKIKLIQMSKFNNTDINVISDINEINDIN